MSSSRRRSAGSLRSPTAAMTGDQTAVASSTSSSNADTRARSRGGARKSDGASSEPAGITFVPIDRSTVVSVSKDRRTLQGHKGYRMVRTIAGVNSGCWYCEFTMVDDAKGAGHARIGWANDLADTSAPVGYDQHSYGYRDVEGQRVHQSIRQKYGTSFRVGDVIGCMINFDTPAEEIAAAEAIDGGISAGPADGQVQHEASAVASDERVGADRYVMEDIFFRNGIAPVRPRWLSATGGDTSELPAMSEEAEQVIRRRVGQEKLELIKSIIMKERLPIHLDTPPENTKVSVNNRYWNSSVRFFVNGVDQGIAFVHLTKQEKYYPAASCYDGAAVRFNPGPTFAFPLDSTRFGEGTFRPVSELEPTLADGLGIASRSVDLTIPYGLGHGLTIILGKGAAPPYAKGELSLESMLGSTGSIPKAVIGALSIGVSEGPVPSALEAAAKAVAATLEKLSHVPGSTPQSGKKSKAASKGKVADSSPTTAVKRSREPISRTNNTVQDTEDSASKKPRKR